MMTLLSNLFTFAAHDKFIQSLKFDVYSPAQSTTSRKVPCSSNLCDLQTACRSKSISCPYSIQYLSDNTSSSGVLVEDVLYLTSDSAQSKIVTAPIMFGYVLYDPPHAYDRSVVVLNFV